VGKENVRCAALQVREMGQSGELRKGGGGDVPFVERQNTICTADRRSDEVRLPTRVLRSLSAYFVTTLRAHLHVSTCPPARVNFNPLLEGSVVTECNMMYSRTG